MRRCLMMAGLSLIVIAPATAAEKKVSYRNDVQPILQRHCWGCHSSTKPRGKLSLDTVAAMRKGGRNGPLFEPGKPDDSRLLDAITGPEPSMPQKQPPLSMEKVQVLRQWILQGAADDSTGEKPRLEIKAPQTYAFAPAITSVALSGDGKRLAAACRSEVLLLDVEGTAPPRRVPTTSDLLTHVEFSPDGKLLAASGGTPAQYGEVQFLDPSDGRLLATRRSGKDTLFRGTFLPDGKAIALGGADGAVHVIPVDGKQPVRRFELHSDWILAVACTPDGKMLVTGGRDKTTKIANAQTGELLRTLDTSAEMIGAVAADNLTAVSAGRARTLQAYDFKIALTGVPTNQFVRPIEAQPGEVHALAVSGDRKVLAAGGNYGEVRVYTLATRQRLGLIGKVPAPVYSVALNANGSRLALGSKSGLVEVYELPSGKRLKSLVPVPVAAGGRVASK